MLGLLAAVFVVVGVVVAVAFGLASGWDDLAGTAVGGVFLVIGLGLGWNAMTMRREELLFRVPPPPAPPGSREWADVADRIRARFEGTPFVVETEGSVIRVRADLADATFLTWAAARHLREVVTVEAVAVKPGQAITRDVVQGLEVTAGLGRLTGRGRVFSGRRVSRTRHVEYGVGADGTFGRQVDIDVGSAEIQGPVDEVLTATGWRPSWWAALPAEAKGGVVMGAVGLLGAIATGVAVLVQALT